MNVLFFCPKARQSSSEQVLRILKDSSARTGQLNIDAFEERSTTFSLLGKKYDAVIIVYTSEVELSEPLFEIVRYIDREKPLGRFIFLPKLDGKEIIPAIFHPIRALQLQLIYYSLSEPLDTQLGEFEQDWSNFNNPVPVERPAKRGRGGREQQAGFGLILSASFFILFIIGLITVIVPIAQKTVLNLTPTPIRPPAATAFWMQDSFRAIDTNTRWQEQHYYTGQQAMQTTFSDAGLRLSADPLETDAAYQLDSLQSWPLDDLQSLSFSFSLSALDDPAAESNLFFGLVLSQDNSYQLDCLIIPAKVDGRIQCQIQSPGQTVALNEAVPLSLGIKHTATLVFDPLTYSVQFFLDDQYQGQVEIQSVQYWRGRNFKLQIRDELQKLGSGSYSCQLETLNLAHQP